MVPISVPMLKPPIKRMDNLKKGIKENEVAINYVHNQVQTVVSDLSNSFLHMNTLLIIQLEKSNHLNHEFEEMKLSIVDQYCLHSLYTQKPFSFIT